MEYRQRTSPPPLPTEVVEEICKYLDQHSIHRLCSTCKWLNKAATASLYRNIVVSSLGKRERLLQTLEQQPGLQEFAKTLLCVARNGFHPPGPPHNTRGTSPYITGFGAVFTLPFPKLTKVHVLDFTSSQYESSEDTEKMEKMTYSLIEQAIDQSDPFAQSLEEFHLVGGWKHWNCISNELDIILHPNLKIFVLSNFILYADPPYGNHVTTKESCQPLSLYITRCVFRAKALRRLLSFRSNIQNLYITYYTPYPTVRTVSESNMFRSVVGYQTALSPLSDSLRTLSISHHTNLMPGSLDLSKFRCLENLRIDPAWLTHCKGSDPSPRDLSKCLPLSLRVIALDPVNPYSRDPRPLPSQVPLPDEELCLVLTLLIDRKNVPRLETLWLCNTRNGLTNELEDCEILSRLVLSSAVDLRMRSCQPALTRMVTVRKDDKDLEVAVLDRIMLAKASKWFEEIVKDSESRRNLEQSLLI